MIQFKLLQLRLTTHNDLQRDRVRDNLQACIDHLTNQTVSRSPAMPRILYQPHLCTSGEVWSWLWPQNERILDSEYHMPIFSYEMLLAHYSMK